MDAPEERPIELGYAPVRARSSRVGLFEKVVLAAIMLVCIILFLPSRTTNCSLSPKTTCSRNLRSIGQGLYAYSSNHGSGADLSAGWEKRLIKSDEITAKMLICPMAGTGKASYYFLPAHPGGAEETRIVGYEDPSNHNGEGGNILYLDGHVEWVPAPRYRAIHTSLIPATTRPNPGK